MERLLALSEQQAAFLISQESVSTTCRAHRHLARLPPVTPGPEATDTNTGPVPRALLGTARARCFSVMSLNGKTRTTPVLDPRLR